jgi:hypothetical protein
MGQLAQLQDVPCLFIYYIPEYLGSLQDVLYPYVNYGHCTTFGAEN